jgi:hypothetical protein
MGRLTPLAIRIGAISWMPRLLPETEGDERARMWQVMLRTWPNFAKYERRTDRLIPVFLLTRR